MYLRNLAKNPYWGVLVSYPCDLGSSNRRKELCQLGLGVQGHMGCWGSEWYCSGEGECTGEGCGGDGHFGGNGGWGVC
uniref:Uncharacterized protein n=1 Tax=Tanacetum cinerariifolium TaxID=118510 RepID=A0A699JWS7_TANCI|nr:hypothetical protein [Tanacetum cinerariifolium]